MKTYYEITKEELDETLYLLDRYLDTLTSSDDYPEVLQRVNEQIEKLNKIKKYAEQ